MKVSELQAALGGLDPNLELYCYSDDEGLRTRERRVYVFHVLGVSQEKALMTRDESGAPRLKFEAGPEAVRLALVEITSDH